MHSRDRVTTKDVAEVYRRELLGPSGDNDLVHCRTRIEEGPGGEESCMIAMEILDEAADQGVFTPDARRCPAPRYAPTGDDAPGRIAEVLEILVHDGYLEAVEKGGHRFPFRLLRDWWSARCRDHHTPLRSRVSGEDRGGLR